MAAEGRKKAVARKIFDADDRAGDDQNPIWWLAILA
jgi:hypothetical protein